MHYVTINIDGIQKYKQPQKLIHQIFHIVLQSTIPCANSIVVELHAQNVNETIHIQTHRSSTTQSESTPVKMLGDFENLIWNILAHKWQTKLNRSHDELCRWARSQTLHVSIVSVREWEGEKLPSNQFN